jgi:hypothetical protein
VATEVTVVVVRGARTVVVYSVTPKQLQADEYSARSSQEDAYAGMALGTTVTWRASTSRFATTEVIVAPSGTKEVTVTVLHNGALVIVISGCLR